MKIYKRDAAATQIDDAILLFFDGHMTSAITLAGAAETSLPNNSRSNDTLFDLMKKHGTKNTGFSEKEISSHHFNKIRNFLKHYNASDPYVDVYKEDAAIMIIRAYTKFTSTFGNEFITTPMKTFESWYRNEYLHWL